MTKGLLMMEGHLTYAQHQNLRSDNLSYHPSLKLLIHNRHSRTLKMSKKIPTNKMNLTFSHILSAQELRSAVCVNDKLLYDFS